MDVGLVPGNYHDYPDDEVAVQREFEIGDSLDSNYRDEDFPANARSLYFDPLNPPKGSIPNENVKWFSISRGEVIDCDYPIFYNGDADSSIITQGALGDGYFINALRLLSCKPPMIERILVSDKFASQGLYTLKFYKAGHWRYVHIDDRIPCRPSGRVNFARNLNPNEVFAMLIEKAYAKLHGCYEAIPYGLIEKVLQELTPGGGAECLRLERYPIHRICDEVWEAIERGVASNCLIGCGCYLQHPYAVNPSKRKGISLGHIYQVVDACIASAEPTADLDAITLGMICVKNLQRNSGRYTGRWSYGHKLWTQYPEIAAELQYRTREIQHKRGLASNPNEQTEEEAMAKKSQKTQRNRKLYPDDNFDEDDEPDDLDVTYIENDQTVKITQPEAEDLHWIQIEDFVEIFNRVYVLTDLTISLDAAGALRHYASKWIPGDFIGGAGGPPILIHTHARDQEPEDKEEEDGGGGTAVAQGQAQTGDKEDKEGLRVADGKDAGTGAALVTEAKRLSFKDDVADSGAEPKIGAGIIEGKESDGAAGAKGGGEDTANTAAAPAPPQLIVERYAAINDDFTDNPMYPFSVTAPTTLVLSLFQQDKRWSLGRLGEEPREVAVDSFATRGARLGAVMQYPIGIAFLVVRLSGLKHRLTEFKLKKIVAGSEGVVFSNLTSSTLRMEPGRYAVVPYTHRQLDRTMEYLLHAQFNSNHVEFEVDDLLQQRLMDDDPSEEDEDEELQPDDNDLLRLHNDSDDVSIMSYEQLVLKGDDEEGQGTGGVDGGDAVAVAAAGEYSHGKDGALKVGGVEDDDDGGGSLDTGDSALLHPGSMSAKIPPPRLLRYAAWEYSEDTEELGVQHVFGEVGDIMRYVRNLRSEVRKLHGAMRALTAADAQALQQQQQLQQQLQQEQKGMHVSNSDKGGSGKGGAFIKGGRSPAKMGSGKI